MSQIPMQDEDYGHELTAQFMVSDEGDIRIGENVIAEIVKIAAAEMPDVILEVQTLPGKIAAYAVQRVAGAGTEKKEASRGAVEKKDLVKGIFIEHHENKSVSISISVRMAYGKDMSDLGTKLRKHIKSTVEKMTRVPVRRVDVNIVGIMTEKERSRIERERGEQEE